MLLLLLLVIGCIVVALLDDQINFLSFFDLHLLCLLLFRDDDLFWSADALLVGNDVVHLLLMLMISVELAGIAAW